MNSKFDAMGFPVKKLSDQVPLYPATLQVKETETGKVFTATKYGAALYFLTSKWKYTDTGRKVEEKKKSIVSPFRLNKYFEKA